jgi:hypothetical protein
MPDNSKFKSFYVDWWNIRKSTVYIIVATIVLGVSFALAVNYASKNNWFAATDTVDYPKDAARIVSFEGDVRITRAATRETILVTKETYVAAGDTVQTQADGRATIQMIDRSTYNVRPNSTVVIKDTTSIFGGTNVRVSLGDGQINVRTEDQPQDAKNVVEVADSENQLMPKTDASFNADSQTGGGEIRISHGGVETTINGTETTIGENEYAAVNGGKLSTKEKLLAPPQPSAPANGTSIVDNGGGSTVTFSWQDSEGNPSASYYLQVSRSPIFASDAILVDRNQMQTREFRLAGLAPGTYYWRLKGTGRSGQTTNWNDAWKFSIVRGGSGGGIDAADWHVDHVGGSVYVVTGRTQPGMIVNSQGRQTFAGSDGTFRLQISSPSGETNVEVGDDRGNRTGFVINLSSGSVVRRY